MQLVVVGLATDAKEMAALEIKDIEIASKDGCVWCERAIKLVEDWADLSGKEQHVNVRVSKPPAEKGTAEYDEFVLAIKARISPNPHASFPFVWVDGEFVGGYQGLKRQLLR